MHFRKPIDFGVTKRDLVDKPTFAEVRDELATYLEDPDTIVMAHSANNDMQMFNDACKRAKVQPFTFRFICTQMIYSAVYDVENGIGLDKVAVQLGRTQFTHHQADDDSEMALYLLKHCLEKTGFTYDELIKRYGITPGKMHDGSFVSMRCNELFRLRNRRKQRAIAMQKKWNKEVSKGGVITMRLEPRAFDLLKCRSKTIDLRVMDEKRSKIKVGDVVYFIKDCHHAQLLKAKVTEIERFSSFDEAFSALDATAIGYRGYMLLDFLEAMYAIYSETKEYELGVVAFHLELTEE